MTSMRAQAKYNLRTKCPCFGSYGQQDKEKYLDITLLSMLTSLGAFFLGFSFNGHTIVDTSVSKGSCDVFQRIVLVILTVTTLGFSWTVGSVICSSVLIRSLTSLFGRLFLVVLNQYFVCGLLYVILCFLYYLLLHQSFVGLDQFLNLWKLPIMAGDQFIKS